MSLGDQWSKMMGTSVPIEAAFGVLDCYYQAGGNFINVAPVYQDGQAECNVGAWMEARRNRDEIVLSTKYTTFGQVRKEGRMSGFGVNYAGNNAKNLRTSVEFSLRRLRTDYIDIRFVHSWDYTADVAEVMNGLNDLVRRGKVLYLGVSNMLRRLGPVLAWQPT